MASIRDYYSQSSPGYARTVVSKLFGAVTKLEAFPRVGRAVPEIEDVAFRELIVEGCRVVYLVIGEGEGIGVEGLAIAYGRQDLARKLSRRS